MSTQIKYKGSPVVTFNKGTVRLKTDDFGLEGDIEVVSEGRFGGTPEEYNGEVEVEGEARPMEFYNNEVNVEGEANPMEYYDGTVVVE